MKLDFCVSYNYTQRDLFLSPSTTPSSSHHQPQLQPLPPQQQPPAVVAVAAPSSSNSSRRRRRNSAEIPPKTRYKQKQNEIHYKNSTHFIRLTLSKVETPPLAVLHNTSENTVGENHY